MLYLTPRYCNAQVQAKSIPRSNSVVPFSAVAPNPVASLPTTPSSGRATPNVSTRLAQITSKSRAEYTSMITKYKLSLENISESSTGYWGKQTPAGMRSGKLQKGDVVKK
jgi:hypothetical protein